MPLRPLERIPLHDHANRNAGGPLHGPSVSGLVGGTGTTTTTYATLPPGTAPGTSLIWDGSMWREGYPGAPLILEDGTVAILEDGSAAIGEPTYV